MRLSEVRGGADEARAAERLLEVAADRDRDPGLRAWAFRSTARLHHLPAPVLERLGTVVADAAEPPVVRAWAAVALGQPRRKEGISWFLRALATPIDRETAYHVLEGLAKVVPLIVADPDLNGRVVEALTAFAARQPEFTADMYDLVSESVTNLPLLVTALERKSVSASDPVEVYAAVYALLHHLVVARDAYAASAAERASALRAATERALAARPRAHPAIDRLIAWSAGRLGDKPELAAPWAAPLGPWARAADPRLRAIAAWSLARMDAHAEAAHRALLDALAHETDERVLAALAGAAAGAARPDALQMILRVPLAPEGR